MPDKQGDRIKAVRKNANLNQEEFGRAIGLAGNSAVSQFEKGTAKPKESTLRLICEKFNVNYEWLISGQGDMLKPAPVRNEDSHTIPASQLFKMWESSEQERKSIQAAFLQLLDTHNKVMDTHNKVLRTKFRLAD